MSSVKSDGLEKCNLKPEIKYLDLDAKEHYLIADKCFYPKEPEEFNNLITDFTKNDKNYIYYPIDSSYIMEDGKIHFKNSEDEIISFNYIPICSVSGNIKIINEKKIASLLWAWNNESLGVAQSPELKKKIELLKELNHYDFKLSQHGLAFREQEFKDPIDSALYQASIYTAWFCKKLDGFKIFCNFSSGGMRIELKEFEKKHYGLSHITRPYTFIILYK
jgi:hypothetical protein